MVYKFVNSVGLLNQVSLHDVHSLIIYDMPGIACYLCCMDYININICKYILYIHANLHSSMFLHCTTWLDGVSLVGRYPPDDCGFY